MFYGVGFLCRIFFLFISGVKEIFASICILLVFIFVDFHFYVTK